MDIIVADSGPLIALAKTGLITLLKELFKTVYIPQAVKEDTPLTNIIGTLRSRELCIFDNRPGSKELRRMIANEKWIKVKKITIPAHSNLPLLLDAGEAEAIFLAEKMNALILIDEKKGRRIARKHNLNIIGTGRLFIAAKEKGYLDSVTAALTKLNNAGYRLSKNLITKIIKLAKE